MDWKERVKKFPKAMDAFCISKFGGDVKKCMVNGKEDRFWGALSLINDRELYDFFDGHGIFITLKVVNGWDYTISDGKGHLLDTEYDYQDTRKEAETAAFMKAFKILEPKLKDGTTPVTLQKV